MYECLGDHRICRVALLNLHFGDDDDYNDDDDDDDANQKVVDHRKLEDDGEGAETEEAKDGKT